MKPRWLPLLILMSLPLLALADLKSNIDQTLSNPALKRASVGVIVVSLDNKQTVYERNADLLLTPASNTKLLTSASALHLLGPDFKYTTKVYRRGELADGVLKGDLIFKGSGDPTMEPADIESLADQIVKAGVKKIEGGARFDDTAFDTERASDGWSIDDTIWYYGAEISPLMVARNAVAVYISPGEKEGDAPKVRIAPETAYLEVRNYAATRPKGAKSTPIVTRLLNRNVITINGGIDIDAKETHTETIAVVDASRYVAALLTEALQRKGVEVGSSPRFGQHEKTDIEIASHTSPPMSKIIALFNKPSDNLIGECLLKTLGMAKGNLGTVSNGRRAELEFLKEAGLETDGLQIFDGSGLSRMTGVTARNFAQLLIYMFNHPHAQIYRDSLPVGGKDGTMRNRLKTSPAKERVFAKTGSLFSVSALSGYVQAKSGKWYAFSILMNRFIGSTANARQLQDEIVEHIYKEND